MISWDHFRSNMWWCNEHWLHIASANNGPSSSDVDGRKLQKSNSYTRTHLDIFCLRILSTTAPRLFYNDNYNATSYGSPLTDSIFSVILQNTSTIIYVLFISSLESIGVWYLTPPHSASIQEGVMQFSSRFKKDPWHLESRHILRILRYPNTIFNSIYYMINTNTKKGVWHSPWMWALW